MAGFGKLRIWASLFCRFFLHFDFLLGCLFEGFFICVPSLFRDLFFKWFCLNISSFFWFSLFGRTLGDTHSTRWNIWFPYIHLFRKRRFSINTLFDKYQMTASFSHWFFINFHDLFGIDFRIVFLCLLRENGSKNERSCCTRASQKTILFKTFSVISILCRCWLTLGSFLANCWCPLALFWRPWAHFLVPSGSLLVTLALDFLTFGAF